MVMRTIGFNWGAAGCGTSLWSGPLLANVLRKAGIKEEDTWDYHCEMVGYEDLPNKVGPGPYNWPEKVKVSGGEGRMEQRMAGAKQQLEL